MKASIGISKKRSREEGRKGVKRRKGEKGVKRRKRKMTIYRK